MTIPNEAESVETNNLQQPDIHRPGAEAEEGPAPEGGHGKRWRRRLLTTIAGAFGASVVVGLYFALDDWYERKQTDSVVVTITYSPERCGAEYPLAMTVWNGSSRTVHDVSWELAIYRPGFSTNLAGPRGARFTSDKILAANEGWTICGKTIGLEPNSNETLTSLEYVSKDKFVTFEGGVLRYAPR